ncbi:THAP domain containing 12a isoform X2 [Neoarius graeffei]|uniref:THAP domain containing 12a isoform X2 n=1 Tax=Neoarius graeffei TaxID=443677 RepID=UPI00298D0A87|nr:THAP domain containing 12a isoform X2 [Neoarius graeffei]
MPNFCAALHCSRMSSHSVLAFFRFPRDPERCKKWVENCSRSDLRDKTPEHLNKYHRLCARHFEPDLILKTSPFRTVLKDTAIPTIFDHPIRKRTNEQEEENAPQAKVQKVENQDKNAENATESTNGQEAVEGLLNEETPVLDKDRDQREYLRSLFDVVVMMGRQNIPLQGHSDTEPRSKAFTPSNFQALLEFRINAGDEALRRRFETSPASLEFCSSTQLHQILEVGERCVSDELLSEVKEARFFSLVMENVVELAGENRIPTFIRFVDQNNCLREEFLGFVLFEGDVESIIGNLCAEMAEKNGLSMEDCRGQAYFSTGVHASKVKAVVMKLSERYPLAVLTPSSSHALNISLANSMDFTSVQLVMSTLKKIAAFFSRSPLLLDQLESAVSIYYQGNEEKASVLKQVCRTDWTQQHDAFEVAVDLLESLLLCMDSIHDNMELKWSDEIAHEAFVVSEALADFEFVMTLVVLKNTLSFSRAFGKNLQGQTSEVFFAANSLTAVLHSLNEILENIEVYHEFWFEEAVNLAAALEIPVKIPRLFFRKQRPDTGDEIQPETYYKVHLTFPVVTQVIKELSEFFSENHLNALRSLSFVPAIMSQLKFNTEENSADVYKNDLPNPETLPTELNCWKIKWKHGTKNVTLPSTIYETLQLSDVKFFPNVCALLKVLHCLPVLSLTEEKCSEARRRLTAYLRDMPPKHRHKSLALFSINCAVKVDVDLMVEAYLTAYPDKETTEEPA